MWRRKDPELQLLTARYAVYRTWLDERGFFEQSSRALKVFKCPNRDRNAGVLSQAQDWAIAYAEKHDCSVSVHLQFFDSRGREVDQEMDEFMYSSTADGERMQEKLNSLLTK